MLYLVNKSQNRQHTLVYLCLLAFWFCLRLFRNNAFDLGWGFFPLVISLPFLPFILVWLVVQFYRHVSVFKQAASPNWHLYHGLCCLVLFVLFVFNFIF